MKRAESWASRGVLLGPFLGSLLGLILAGCGGGDEPEEAPPPGDVNVDLFSGLLGKSGAEVDEKVSTAVGRFFGIGTDEPNELIVQTGYRCYYELPQDPTLGFIWAADSSDVRSEGMSYGMMIAVQSDLHEQFDRLWKFAKTYMQFPADDAIVAWRGYFRWQGRVDATDPTTWVVNYNPTQVPAPDGDEYFAAALFLAHRRWGSDGDVNYLAEAQSIASSLLNNPVAQGDAAAMVPPRFPIIHQTEKMVTFVPVGNANDFSDPSYHLPAFYELFARDGVAADSSAWTSVAETSRKYLVLSAHPTTGLHPDYADFTGKPVAGGSAQMPQKHDQFQYDAWRVVMNMAVDYAWFSKDRRMKQQIEKYHAFFSSQLSDNNVQAALFAIDGSEPSGGGSTALTATLAAGSLASRHPDRERFVSNLWNVSQQQGQYRYYQEGVYLLGLLNTAGRFRYSWP
jgi:oligosaccharide reducing-end xylanase